MEIFIKYDDNDIEIMYVPQCIFENIEEHQRNFFKWLFDKNNDHQYWRYLDGNKSYCEYDANAFVQWLNEIILYESNEKAAIVEKNGSIHNSITKVIYF